jgi:hypothetical protein
MNQIQISHWFVKLAWFMVRHSVNHLDQMVSLHFSIQVDQIQRLPLLKVTVDQS